MKNKIIALYVFIVPALALAQASLPVDSGNSVLDKLAHFLHDLPAATIASALMVLEVILRVIPTTAPASILVPVKKALDMVVYILSFLSDLLAQVVNVANNVK